MVDDNPVNYGNGYCEFKIIPQFYNGKEPKYNENFYFNQILYLSNYLEDEFEKTLEFYGGKDKIIFHNYEK